MTHPPPTSTTEPVNYATLLHQETTAHSSQSQGTMNGIVLSSSIVCMNGIVQYETIAFKVSLYIIQDNHLGLTQLMITTDIIFSCIQLHTT